MKTLATLVLVGLGFGMLYQVLTPFKASIDKLTSAMKTR